MRGPMILVMSVMPLVAQMPQDPISAQLSGVSVVFGPGTVRDRTGGTPAPQFKPKLSGELHLEGLHSRVRPHFRFWLVKAGDELKLKRVPPGPLKAELLSARPATRTETGYSFEIAWTKADVDPDDRLFVEVFMGRRRAATAISGIQSHFLPASRPKDREANN